MLLLSLLLTFSLSSTEPPAAWGPTPTAEQLQFHREELSSFIHYGVNTYTGREWGDGTEDPNVFKPTALDTDQWVRTLQGAGFKRVIITSKHHDGFCLFKSQYTKHQVNESKDFQDISQFLQQSGDVVEELSKSCTKYNMNMGLYLSPWDRNSSLYGDDTKYNQYYMSQLTEILSNHKKYGNNGKFVEMWLDSAKGAGEKDQTYWFTEWFKIVKQHQPQMIIYSDYGSEARWVGNEDGIAGEPCWSRFDLENQKHCFDKKSDCKSFDLSHGDANGPDYSVAECDVSVTDGWFWTTGRKPKTMSELTNIYFKSVGRGQPLLLNVPPNIEGKLPDNFVERVSEFGETIRNTFAHDFAMDAGVTFSATNVRGEGQTERFSPKNTADNSTETYWTMEDDHKTGSLTINFNKVVKINIISIKEHMPLGQRISKFSVEVHTKGGAWKSFESGPTIGNHRLCRQSPIEVDQIRLNILESQAVPVIEEFGAFLGTGAFAKIENDGEVAFGKYQKEEIIKKEIDMKIFDNKDTEEENKSNTKNNEIKVVCTVSAAAVAALAIIAAVAIVAKRRKNKDNEEKIENEPLAQKGEEVYTSA